MKSPGDQKVTWVELFFDLVFVFAVTQVVVLLEHDLSGRTIVQAILIFWLIWWSWTQFTWTLNLMDTTHSFVQFITLVTTAVAFLMATTIPRAFGGRALWFAIPYVLTRVIGLSLQIKIADTQKQKDAVRIWLFGSLGGLTSVVVGGFVGGDLQYVFWILTIILDFIAAILGARGGGWELYPEHFSERHGLIMIIALGESLIVAAGGLVNEEFNLRVIGIGMLALAMICALWWSYFVKTQPILEHAMGITPAVERGKLARDAFSLFHFPMLAGIISYTLAVDSAIAHPTSNQLTDEARMALAVGLLLFIGGTALAVLRASGEIMIGRIVLILILSFVIFVGIIPIHELWLGFIGVLTIVIFEQVSPPRLGSAD
ncbi:MAG: low temperature requirement protein A [Candidatus Heimdallarchaeota archaeon]|nr:low temperature requirement protein A [Candidatus Heimdallarchaeota archaeon]